MQTNILEIVEKQRKKVFLASSILVIGIVINTIGLSTCIVNNFFLITNLCYVTIVTLSLFFTLIFKKIPLQIAVICILLSIELVVCTESILYSFDNTPYSRLLIIANMTISVIVILMSLLAYLHYVTYILASTTIISYTVCAFIANNEDLWELYIIFILFFGIGVSLSSLLSNGVNKIIRENLQLETNAQQVLSSLGLTESEFKTYLYLIQKNKIDDNKIDLFNQVKGGSYVKIRKDIAIIIKKENAEYDKIKKAIPEFTLSEIMIAKLIIEGEKMKKITEILDKKKSNITCQRSRMRNKLNLDETDNLREAIIKRISV